MTVNFSPNNAIVRLCLLGMQQEETGDPLQGGRLYQQAWQEAANDFEKYLAAYFIARNQPAPGERLRWYEASLERALRIGDEAVKSAYATLYTRMA